MTDLEPLHSHLESALGASYAIERELGGGGMSRVFVARERTLERRVVLKLLLPDLAAGVSAERFRREIQLAAGLQHACIVPLLSAGVVEVEGQPLPYFTMPFVEGEALRARLAREGPLPVPEVVRILRDVAEALSHAHERGIVHRDVKPDNILLTRHHALVADFGVAKALSAAAERSGALTSLGVALGTPAYMAPEQAAADPGTDHRADLYAFGATAYEMLTGQPVFAARGAQAMLAAHATESPVPVAVRRAAVPPALADLVMRCLAKLPADRPRNADDILRALDGVLTPSGGLAPTEAHPVRVGAPRRSRAVLLGSVAALLATAGLGVWWTRARASAVTRGIERIALLPLANTTGDTSQSFVADGLTREVISALTSGGVRVIGYASASRYAPDAPLARVARELGVDAVAVGALRRATPRLHVSLELTDPGSGENLWAGSYTVDTSELAGLAGRAARELATAVHVPSTRTPGRAPPNRAAYAEFLLGQQRSSGWTPEAYRRTIEHYSRAIALDSGFARAWAGLAKTHASYATFYDWVPADASAKALVAAERALALDPAAGEAHLARALVKQARDWDWAGAERDFQRALALERSSTVHDLYAFFLLAMGRFQEAVAMGEKAVEIDPTAGALHSDLSGLLRESGDLERAREQAITAIRLDSTHAESRMALAWALVLLGRTPEGVASFDRYEALFGEGRPLERAALYAHGGRVVEARSLLAEQERREGGTVTGAFYAAAAHVALGDLERTLELLRILTERREFWWPSYTLWDPVRGDPRFAELVNRMGLPQAARP